MTRFYPAVILFPVIILCTAFRPLTARPLRDGGAPVQELPLRKITVYSSGVSFFEHSAVLTGPAALRLPFKTAALNDALKSLMLHDPASAFPLISYSPEQGLSQALQSLGVDLSGNPGITEILEKLRGEELEVSAPDPIRGRIMALEYRRARGGGPAEPWLSLFGPQGVRLLNLSEAVSLRFTNESLNAGLERALDLITASRNSGTRELAVSLPGGGTRPVSLSYVIPSPVWKVSYRLDLGDGNSASARFQGWAIVDNDGDEDWRNVELSLAAGRPVSFTQNLYPPYYQSRPALPLSIAGSAAPVTYAEAVEENMDVAYEPVYEAKAAAPRAVAAPQAPLPVTGTDMADQFSFTLTEAVNLDRRSSAMFPLLNGEIAVRRFLIFSGAGTGRSLHPNLGAELRNTTGLRLPAGPITVYDGASYAGDALLEFLNRDEKRLISWGEDLSVTGTADSSGSLTLSAVTISGGLMTISRRQGFEKIYRFRNTAPEAKTIVVEHPVNGGAALVEPEHYDEASTAAYRFIREIPAGGREPGEAELRVREERVVSQQVTLLGLHPQALLSYSTNQEIPAGVRALLAEAVERKRRAEDAEKAGTETEDRRNERAAEQDRIRKNLEAAGNGTPQGQDYLLRLTSLDEEIDRLNGELERRRAEIREARDAYESYLRNLSF
jgi:hypothetical protein